MNSITPNKASKSAIARPNFISCRVMHKRFNRGEEQQGLAVGRTFRFKSGAAYQVQESGAVVNVNPKPHVSKADRKALKRARVAQRHEASSHHRQ